MNEYQVTDFSQALFEEAGDALFLVEPESDRVLDANPTALRLSGFTRQELLRLTATYLFRSEGKGGLNRLRQAAQRTGPFHSQEGYYLRNKQDTWVPVNLTIARLHVQPQTLSLITARDVREQREAHAQLRRMEAELRRVMDSVVDCLWSASIDDRGVWTFSYVSPVIENITGRPAEFFRVGLEHWRSIVIEEDLPTWDLMQEQLQSGAAREDEFRILHADGSLRWVRVSVAVDYDLDTGALRLDGVLSDATSRKRAEEELARERDLLHALMDNVPDLIYLKDAASRFTRINKAHAGYLGLADPSEAVGCSDFDFYSDTEARSFYADEQQLLAAGQSVINKLEMQARSDGTTRWILTTKVPIVGPDGQVAGLIGVSRDITDRKNAEQALARERSLLRSLIDAIPDLIFYKDRDGIYLGCNAAFERYSGRSEHDTVGRSDYDLLPRELADFYRAKDQQVLAEGRSRRDEEWLSYPDGSQMLVETVQTPFHEPSGELWGLIGMCRDITERKRLEEQLRQSQKMEAIGQLAGGVAHDFNNLLTAILGNVSLLLSNKSADDPDRELLAATEQAAERATDLTRQLLGFSRQTMLRLESVNLNAAILEVVTILHRTIDPRIVLEPRPAEALWLVQADPGQVSQVLMNLCINARDAMPEGGRLTLEAVNVLLDEQLIRTQLEARAGEFVRLRVRDSGCGIPESVRARIFEPFFTTKQPGKGTGLGLAMVYGIVQQHQGWIDCRSEVGKGTTFDIYIPRCQTENSRSAAAAPAPTRRGSETLLLVDDEAVIRNVGRAILQRQGYEVLLAEDGLEAIEVYRREHGRIALVILDLTMPRLSGLDTLRQLVQFDPEAAILLSSGYSVEQMPEVGKEGVLGFVNKPYRPQDLTDAVRGALDRVHNGQRPSADGAHAGSWVI
jgi:PAS domain S-box-containing protein